MRQISFTRVYLGGDHGGYDLKQAIVEHLFHAGHEPIDCGAYSYDADDDYPAFCIAAAVRTVADPDSLGIVLGSSGNGEQTQGIKFLVRVARWRGVRKRHPLRVNTTTLS